MSIYKKPDSAYYWFKFMFKGKLYQRPSKVKNKRVAEQIEAAFRTQLAKGEVSLQDQKPVPALREFAQSFIDFVSTRHANKPETVRFYANRLKRLLEWESFLDAKLDCIDEALIERYIFSRRKEVGIVAVNRELATLRRLLRIAHEWKLIRSVPKVRLLPGETSRDFTLDRDMEHAYLQACPPVLHDVAVLLIDSGLRVGEASALKWSDVHLDPIGNSRYGCIQVRDGKSKNAKRVVPLVPRSHKLLKGKWDALEMRQETAKSEGNSEAAVSEWVFPGDSPDRAILTTSLAHMHTKVCRPIIDGKQVFSFPEKFVLHSLRHTFLTRLGEAGADAFTIMKIAGHSSVTVSQRYVHPTSGTVELAFERMDRLGQKALEAESNAA